MENQERRAAYAGLWAFALAFGWIEASVVVYLREIYAREAAGATDYFPGLQVTLVSLPGRLVALEMAREACTILLLGAVAWLAGRRLAARAGASLLAFGIWDMTYYAALKLVLDWPDSPGAWDILFLIPLPWVAPVWAPVTVAALFVAAGSYLFWTAERERRYRPPDIGMFVVAVLLTIGAFLVESGAAIDRRVPDRFPGWLFWAGVLLGTAWFVRLERHAVMQTRTRSRQGAALEPTTLRPSEFRSAMAPARGGEQNRPVTGGGVGDPIREYSEARQRLGALEREAGDAGERLGRLAQGLSAHPARIVIGSDPFIENPSEWDVVLDRPLPSIESLALLTNEIREAYKRVGELRERVVLLGRADLVEQPDTYFQ